MRATAVIDVGFGDAGKGLMTDFLAAPEPDKTLVVRFNGGAQAGHTVVAPDGTRHVFSHYGAGTLVGARTHLSQFFICNPFLWRKEFDGLAKIGVQPPPLSISPLSMMTTPYDMLVNQEAERQRGGGKHGSCGVGINETVTRCLNGAAGTTAQMMWHPGLLQTYLFKISRMVPARMKMLNLSVTPSFEERLKTIDDQSFIQTCRAMAECCRLESLNAASASGKHLIFEGAQGLLLDEKHEFFPHVTRSRTGLTNVVELLRQTGIKQVDVVYVTRTYMTRHGAGPFPSYRPKMRFDDATNQPNKWQGSLRFGEIDGPLIFQAVNRDLAGCSWAVPFPVMAVTHCDQRPDADARKIAHACGVPLGYVSCGPTRNDVAAVA